jgi:hypothetical protein
MDPFRLASIAQRVANLHRVAYLEKKGDKWCVRSEHNPSWNGGCYESKGEAQHRLRQVEFFKHKKSSCACGGACGGTASCAACDSSPGPCSCEHRLASIPEDAPEYDSVEDFVQFLMDDDQGEFTHEDLTILNARTKQPVAKIRKELEGYGLKMRIREKEKKVRGITDNPHGTSPFSGMSGGAAYQSVIDSKYGRNPFNQDDYVPKPDTGFRKPFSGD